MTRRSMCGMAMLVTTMIVTTLAPGVSAQEQIDYEVHDGRRPQPTVITPGTSSTDERPGKPPSDAIVLFDGKDLSQWQSIQGGEAPWKVLQGEIQIIPGSGSIETRQRFGDMQLHLEWLEPMRTEGRGQQRGNSGVFLQGLYEIQVLDNYQNETYPDGMAGALYGQYPPLVNACRSQGTWQVYDIIFHVATLRNGKLVRPARVTAFLNGVLVQDDTELIGPTVHQLLASYPTSLPDQGPLQLQDHNDPVRYRNIWIRPLSAGNPQPPVKLAGGHDYEKTPH